MDLFLYNPTYHLWICTAPRCQYARPWANPAREPGLFPPPGGPPDQDGHWGRGWLLVPRARARAEARLAKRVVSCQRFYLAQASSHFFIVTCTAGPAAPGVKKRPVLTPAELVRARVDQALREGEAATEWEASQVLVILDPHPIEVSLWLELTWWPEYLRGQDLTTINTFFRQPSVWNQPIQIRLQPKTYHHYSQVWQRLVCFTYRSTRPDQAIQLRHQLNTSQLAALDRMEEHGRGLVALAAEPIKPHTPVVASQDAPPPTPPTPNLLPRRTGCLQRAGW
ncbi:hypothetical protein BJX65DRAFT_318412 [Aspergillus insuetus]